jgi:hypothetical protein
MAREILYEKQMWDWSIIQLRDHREPGPLHNAHVEVFVWHSRGLAEFFRCQPHHDDVVASDYIVDWDGGDAVRFLDEAHHSINKRAAHISLYRLNQGALEPDQQRWSNNVHHLTILWDRFLGGLSVVQRSWFNEERLPR